MYIVIAAALIFLALLLAQGAREKFSCFPGQKYVDGECK